MQKPDSNAPGGMQPWIRWNESEVEELKANDSVFAQQLEALLRGDGGQAGSIANILSTIARMQYELEFLYNATGTPYPPGTAPPAPPAPVEPTTIEMSADWSRTWGSSSYYTSPSGTYTNSTYLYQGQNPENKVGMWRFDVGSAAGRTIVGASIFLQNIDSPWATPFVAQFGTHGNVAAPVGKPGRSNPFDVGWARGEGKWAPVPDWAWGGLSNGSIQGFTVGAAGPSDPNSAFFMGVGQPNPPRLRITYV